MIDTICDFLVGCGFVGVEFNVYNADADIVIGGRVCGRVLYIDGVVGVVVDSVECALVKFGDCL